MRSPGQIEGNHKYSCRDFIHNLTNSGTYILIQLHHQSTVINRVHWIIISFNTVSTSYNCVRTELQTVTVITPIKSHNMKIPHLLYSIYPCHIFSGYSGSAVVVIISIYLSWGCGIC